MPGCRIGLPTANETPNATLSWAVSSAHASYPVTNAATLEPDVVAKAIADTATLRATFGVARTLVAVGLFNINAHGQTITLSNNGGMVAQTRTAGTPEDGLSNNVWFDLEDVAGTSATQWEVAFPGASGADPAAIGTLVLLSAVIEPHLRWNYEIRERFPAIEHRTSYGKRLQYQIPTRFRAFEAIAHWAEDRDLLRSLRRSVNGTIVPFFLVPDIEDADVFLVQFARQEAQERYAFVSGRFDQDTEDGIVEQPIEVEEVNSGVAL